MDEKSCWPPGRGFLQIFWDSKSCIEEAKTEGRLQFCRRKRYKIGVSEFFVAHKSDPRLFTFLLGAYTACGCLVWLKTKELAASLLSMVAELRNQQLLVFTCLLSASLLWNRSFQSTSLNMREQRGSQAPSFNGDLGDLESFQACREESRAYMSQVNPSLYEVLGEIVFSKQPIGEGNILQASQRILKEKHRALSVFQAKMERANFTKEQAHQLSIDEYKTTEADKLQTSKAERQLGCILVLKTKGETQLQVCRWLSTANSWEAWRQLNLQSKRSIYFELLANIMNMSFDTQPASCLHQFNAWREQVVGYQKLSGEQLPDSIKISAVVNGLSSSVRDLVLLNLDGNCSFEDLDNLLTTYLSMHDKQVFSSPNPWDRTCNDKQKEKCKGKGQESNPSFKQQLGEGGQSQVKKSKGEVYPPQPPAYEGQGKPDQLPQRKQWCSICWKKGHRT